MSCDTSLAPTPDPVLVLSKNDVASGSETATALLERDPLREEGKGEGEEWEKVLWRRQPFADDYVPPSFLAELRDLPPRPLPSLKGMFITALPISQHISVTALFLAIFNGLLEGRFSAAQVGWGCAGMGVLGRWIWVWGWGGSASGSPPGNLASPLIPAPTPLRPLLLPPLLLSLLSPILGTLTSATTSDTIWPLSAGLFGVHLLLADFGTGEDRRRRSARIRAEARRRRMSVASASASGRRAGAGGAGDGEAGAGKGKGELEDVAEKSLTSSLSLTSALSASIVLASRLPSTAHVFSLVLLAVLLFAGWPRIARAVRESGPRFSLLLTISLSTLAISLFSVPTRPSPSPLSVTSGTSPSPSYRPFIPSTPTLIFLAILVLVNLGGPVMLRFSWRWKVRRGGGWDVAVVRVRKGREG